MTSMQLREVCIRLAGLGVLMVVFGACAGVQERRHPPAGPVSKDALGHVDALRVRMRELEREIRFLIGEAVCSKSSDCRSLAFGEKPCGGPWSYLVYSAAYTEVTVLEKKVRDYNALNARWNDLTGAVSDCRFVEEPAVGCKAGTCVECSTGEAPGMQK